MPFNNVEKSYKISGGIYQNLSALPQQKNMELWTFSCNLGSSGMGELPTEVTFPEEVSERSSNFINCPI
jgi:hypothetical protein